MSGESIRRAGRVHVTVPRRATNRNAMRTPVENLYKTVIPSTTPASMASTRALPACAAFIDSSAMPIAEEAAGVRQVVRRDEAEQRVIEQRVACRLASTAISRRGCCSPSNQQWCNAQHTPRKCRGQPLTLKLTNILWLGRRGPSAQLRLINTRRAIRTYDRTANGTSNMACDTSLLLIESERASSNIRLTLYTTK